MDDPICENINDPVLKVIVRYRNQPNIVAIKKFCDSKSYFSFKNIQKEEIIKELNKLSINKAPKITDIPTKIVKENSDIWYNWYSSPYQMTFRHFGDNLFNFQCMFI